MTSITGRARRYFERVETEEEPYYAAQQVERQRPTNIIDNDNNNNDDDDDDEQDDGDGDEVATTTTTIEIPLATPVDDDDEEEQELELEVEQSEQEQEPEDEEQNQNQIMYTSSQSSYSLEELEVARDEAIQQSSTFMLTGSYILMMLWLQVFSTYDMTLFLLSLGLSSLFVRYIEYAQQNIDTLNQLVITFTNENGTTTTRSGRRRTSGVDEIVKQQWDTFTFNSRASLAKKENFGTSKSLFTIDDDDDDDDEDYDDKLKIKIVDDDKDDEDDTPSYQHEHQQQQQQQQQTDTDTDIHHPECSICLGEYEKGDKLISLNPCHHIFHDECITSWTNHNIRCPLCNVDLVQVQEQ